LVSSHGPFHGRFIWYELITTDVEAAKTFYTEVLGWGTENAGHGYTLFTTAGATVSGLMHLSDEAKRMGLRPSWLGYVGVDDVDTAADRVKQLGGTAYPPMEIPNVSHLSVAIDPQMATIAVFKWLNGREPPELTAPGGIGWHELLADDWEKAWPFYSELFGWQKARAETSADGTYQAFSAGGQIIGGMIKKPQYIANTFWLYYFNVGDIDDAIKRVKARGGTILEGPVEVPGNRWVVQAIDPQGAVFALEGKRRFDVIGYFAPVPRDPSNPRSGVACTRIS
jgi:predicted enzyme related to lactoylglutathione lyase